MMFLFFSNNDIIAITHDCTLGSPLLSLSLIRVHTKFKNEQKKHQSIEPVLYFRNNAYFHFLPFIHTLALAQMMRASWIWMGTFLHAFAEYWKSWYQSNENGGNTADDYMQNANSKLYRRFSSFNIVLRDDDVQAFSSTLGQSVLGHLDNFYLFVSPFSTKFKRKEHGKGHK